MSGKVIAFRNCVRWACMAALMLVFVAAWCVPVGCVSSLTLEEGTLRTGLDKGLYWSWTKGNSDGVASGVGSSDVGVDDADGSGSRGDPGNAGSRVLEEDVQETVPVHGDRFEASGFEPGSSGWR